MSTDDEICEVIITGPNADWLANFTKSLVADGLAACGQNIATIRSIYRWQGAIEDEPEARVALHTRRALVDAPSSKGPDATIRTTCRASSRSRYLAETPPTSSGYGKRPRLTRGVKRRCNAWSDVIRVPGGGSAAREPRGGSWQREVSCVNNADLARDLRFQTTNNLQSWPADGCHMVTRILPAGWPRAR